MKNYLRSAFALLTVLSCSSLFGADPTVQATNMTITNRTSNSLTATWTRGNGQAVLVSVRASSSTLTYPQDGYAQSYYANANFGSGDNLGSSNFVVYDGTGTSVTITGLAANTTYYVYAWEYNVSYVAPPIDEDYYYYKTTVGSNDNYATTLCSEPTTGPTAPTFSSVSYTSATINWTGGNGTYNLVTADESPYGVYHPVDGTVYTASSTWGSGSATGSDNYVVYLSSGSSVNVTGLKSATSYRARVYDYNCTGGQQNYYTGAYTLADFTTLNYPPTVNGISSATICQDAGFQSLTVTGISDGSSGENQTVSVTATSSNQTLIPNANISVSYTNPNTTATLIYSPATGQYGTAVITVTVNDNFSSTNTTSTSFTVTVKAKPGAAQNISGPVNVCAGGGNYNYTVPAISNATGYTWSVPAGWTIISGTGTNTITAAPSLSASSGNITVYGTNSNGCGNGTSSSYSVSVNPQPATADAGTNQNPVCGSTAFLNATAVSTPSSGMWSVLPGPPAPTIGNANSNSTSVTGLANGQTYNFVWTVTNGGVCPPKKDTVQLVTDFSNGLCTPSANFSYAGSTNSGLAGKVCVNTSVQFTDLSVSADTWDWDFDYSGTFSSMSSLQNPSYTFTATGTFTVQLKIHSNTTGLDYTHDEVIEVIGPPAAPGSISGIFSGICAGDPNQYNYSVAAVTNATGYSWNYPSGVNHSANSADWTLVSVLFSATATDGSVSVTASNGCGTSSASSAAISVNELPDAAGTISETGGLTTFCQGQQGVVFSVPAISNASSYVWIFPSGATGSSTTSSISVDFANNAVSGDIFVYGTNSCGDGTASNLSVSINPLPDPAGAISGNSTFEICPLPSAAGFSVAPIGNATGYTWSVSNGGVITSGSGTNSVTVDFSSAMTSGTIEVSGTNACGAGAVSAQVNLTFNPVVTAELCVVSVDSASNFNEIYWTKPSTDVIDSFRVYRRVSTSSNVLVGTVAYEDDAFIVDSLSGADPNSNFEEYTITVVDTCGNESDSTLFHRTMFLAPPVYGGGTVTLNWNLYVGQTVNFYRILRDTTGSGAAWDVVDTSVNPGVTTWVDNNLPVSGNTNILYRVEVDWFTTCDPSRAIINTSRSNIKNQMVNPTTGISVNDISGTVSLYPNPAKDLLNIEFRKGMINARVEIYDMQGQLVVSQKIQANEHRLQLSTSGLAHGIYMVKIISDNGKGMKKLVVEK